MLFSLDWKKSGRKELISSQEVQRNGFIVSDIATPTPLKQSQTERFALTYVIFPFLEQPGKVDILLPIFLQEETESQRE